MKPRHGFALLLLLAALARPAAAQALLLAIEHDGRRHGSLTLERGLQDSGAFTRENAQIAIAVGGGRELLRFERSSRESADGLPLHQSARITAGAAPREAQAQIRGGRIELQIRHGQRLQRHSLALPPQLLVDAGLQRRIAAQPLQQAWNLDYDELDLFAARTRHVRLSSDGASANGVLALQREVDGEAATTLYWSLAGQHLLPRWNIAGADFASRDCSGGCSAAAEDFVLLDSLALASPFRIPSSARHRRLRYVFEHETGATPFPATGEQRVVARNGRSVVTVCADCGDEAAPTPQQLAQYRSANAWVQSDHPQLLSLARSVRRGGTLRGRMLKLVQWVQTHMDGERQTMGYASALQAADSRAGDCTEFALLLAALARANGLPARVVAGLTYSSRFTGLKHVFSPHAWVQVWDGERWISYDAGLGDFDSTHIVLGIGDGSPQDYADLLQRVRGMKLVAAGQLD